MKIKSVFGVISLGAAVLAASLPTAAQVPVDPASLAGKVPAEVLAKKTSNYIVRMADNPVAGYEGGIKGLRATKPPRGKKLNPRDRAVVAYADYLEGEHDRVMRAVGVGAARKLYSYKYAYNGFAARLTPAQVKALDAMPGVLEVVPDGLLKPDTVSTTDFLELETGIWNELMGAENAGEGIVVGIIDSGIWPENGSFTDRNGTNPKGKSGKLNYRQIPGWNGKCAPGEDFPASDCNQKLIGAQWFNAGFGGDGNIKTIFPYEFVSARDADGHGSHTAATAAGNADVPAEIDGFDFGVASGIAPRARIAAYKSCWGDGADPAGGCFSSDSVAAIDQAVIDGVDVINFSISGSQTSFLDQVETAFLFAADAGVFVAASAGNSGPAASTVAHNSPWLTTVAAGTHDRGFEATVTADGESYTGASLGEGTEELPLVYSADVAGAGVDPGEATLCYPGTLDATLVEGRIVLCDRGEIARVDKSLAVAQAGGAGMILANTGPDSLNADLHSVPTVHVDHFDGDVLRSYAQTDGAMAQLGEGEQVVVEASQVAGFSSRGPALAGAGDILKPDIMAPGVDIIAAVSPAGYGGEEFGILSGTSMSSPHVAGFGALLKQLHPDWSPAMIKSALMTTATRTTNFGNPIGGGAFDYGAGFAQPNDAAAPGLVYDAGWEDWLGFLCGTGELVADYCSAIGIDPSDLNYPSIAVGALAGSQTLSRTVTNVGEAATYTASIEGLDGFNVSVIPSEISPVEGGEATYAVEISRDTAAIDAWYEGAVVWTGDNGKVVRSPVVVQPVELAAPAEVALTGVEGSADVTVTFGYDGEFGVSLDGLEAAMLDDGTVDDDPANDINTALATGEGVSFHFIDVAAGTPLARFALFDDATDGADDLDLYVFGPASAGNPFVAGSGSPTSAERVDIVNPAEDMDETYLVIVHGWETDGPDASYTLHSWSPVGEAGNLTATGPATAVKGEEGTVQLDWESLGGDMRYLGVLRYDNGSEEIKRTVITVDTD